MGTIELKNVYADYKGKEILRNISFNVNDGEYISLLGPTGSGPSFILKVIAGLLPVRSGAVYINGEDVTDKPPEDRFVGYVFEQFNLFPHLSVMENVLFGPRMRDADIKQKRDVALEVLNMMRLEGRSNAISKELSGGMQQRVGVARAVTSGADILLLDQPYRALDAKIREELRFEIRSISKELGVTAIHSTHETEEAMIVSDRVIVCNDGTIEQFDTPEILYKQPNTVFVATFIAESNVYEGFCNGNGVNIGDVKLSCNSSVEGKCIVVIAKQSIVLKEKQSNENNVFKGTVSKIRLLGEFIRFTVMVSDNFTIEVRELLSLERKNYDEYLGKDVFLKIPVDVVKLY